MRKNFSFKFRVNRLFLMIFIALLFVVLWGNSRDKKRNIVLTTSNWNDQVKIGDQRRFITPTILKNVLISEDLDQIYTTLNDIKVMDYKEKVFPLVKDLWSMDFKKHPTVPVKIVMEPIVRVHLADILMQAYKNGAIEINTSELHEYVLGTLSIPDTFVVIDSITILALFDKKSDVDKLVELSKKKIYFQPSVISLGSMCNSYAGKGLKKILELNNDPKAKKFIKRLMADRLDESRSSCKFWIR